MLVRRSFFIILLLLNLKLLGIQHNVRGMLERELEGDKASQSLDEEERILAAKFRPLSQKSSYYIRSGAESDEGPSLSKGSEAGDSSADRQENEIDAEDEDSGFFSNNQV